MEIFSTKERLRRTYYLFQKAILLLLLINMVIVFMIVGENEDNSTLIVIYMTLIVICLLGFIAFDVISTIQRLHDLNKKGTWYFANLIPIYNIIFGIELIFARGTRGANFYGVDPRLIENEKFRKNILRNIGVLFILIVSLIALSILKEERDAGITSMIIENPQVNDCFIYEHKDSTGFNYNIFKIDNIIGDSLIVTSAIYAFRSELDAIDALVKNKESSNDFWSEEEKISIDDLGSMNISKAKRIKNWW